MKKYIFSLVMALLGTVFAQAEIEQFYTLKSVNKGTRLGANFVGYLASEYNDQCGANPATGGIGSPACAVMKATVQPGEAGIALPYYRIVQANHGTNIENFVGWMEDNSVCNLPTTTGSMMGGQGCALIYANPFGETKTTATTADVG